MKMMLKGEKMSEETRRKMGEAKNGKKNVFYGKHHSEESKRKMSESHKARRNQETNNLVRRIS